MIWETLVEEHLGIIPVKFSKIPISGFREEVVWMKSLRTNVLTHWRTTDKELSQKLTLSTFAKVSYNRRQYWIY